MTVKMFCIFLLCLVQIIFGTENDGVKISGTGNNKCGEFCSKTYSAHTFENSSYEKICNHGCELFTVIQFADKMKSMNGDLLNEPERKINATAVEIGCEKECGEAYSDGQFKDVCIKGCSNQTPFEDGQSVRVVIDESSPLFPFANKLISDAFGKFDDFGVRMKERFDNMRKSLFSENRLPSVFDDSDFSKSISNNDDGDFDKSFQRMRARFMKLFDRLNSDNINSQRLVGGAEDVEGGRRNPVMKEPIVFKSHPVIGETKQKNVVGNEDENGDPIVIVKMFPVEDGSDEMVQKLPTPPLNDDVYGDADDGWLACLARRTQNLSLMSRWLLCATLMLSMLCMFWLCLALMRGQHLKRRRMYMQYRAGGKSDVIYFMPPPSYDNKTPISAAYQPLNKEQKIPATPPPAYTPMMDKVDVENEIPKSEN